MDKSFISQGSGIFELSLQSSDMENLLWYSITINHMLDSFLNPSLEHGDCLPGEYWPQEGAICGSRASTKCQKAQQQVSNKAYKYSASTEAAIKHNHGSGSHVGAGFSPIGPQAIFDGAGFREPHCCPPRSTFSRNFETTHFLHFFSAATQTNTEPDP